MQREVKAYIERELRSYPEYKNVLLPELLEEIDAGSPKGECFGRSNIPGRPTEQKAIRLLTNKQLANLRRTLSAVENVVERLDEDKYRLVEMLYWDNKLTPNGIANELSVDRRTVYKWSDAICMAIALELGFIDTDNFKIVIKKR